MQNGVLLIAKAVQFAAKAHNGITRKGPGKGPGKKEAYTNHLAEVGNLLAKATDGNDPELIAAGYLHDTIEDTGVAYTELVREFGKDVADLVRGHSDNKDLSKDAQRGGQVEHARHGSDRLKMLILADKISNNRSSRRDPPEDWDRARTEDYYAFSERVYAVCKGANAYLDAKFEETLAECRQALDAPTRSSFKQAVSSGTPAPA